MRNLMKLAVATSVIALSVAFAGAPQAGGVLSLDEVAVGELDPAKGRDYADSILLYALQQPVLVVDTYTQRVFARHGWIDYQSDYHQLQEHLTSELPVDAAVYNELHALRVNVGHHYCRRQPKCGECPLVDLLPPDGIVQPEC